MAINKNNYLDGDGNYDLKKALADEVIDEFNTHEAENVHLGNNFKIGVKATINQSLPHSLGYTDVVFDSVMYGDSQYFTNNKYLVAKETGLYYAFGHVRFQNNENGRRAVALVSSGGIVSEFVINSISTGSIMMPISLLVQLNAGQTVKLLAKQESGVSLNLEASGDLLRLEMVRIGWFYEKF